MYSRILIHHFPFSNTGIDSSCLLKSSCLRCMMTPPKHPPDSQSILLAVTKNVLPKISKGISDVAQQTPKRGNKKFKFATKGSTIMPSQQQQRGNANCNNQNCNPYSSTLPFRGLLILLQDRLAKIHESVLLDFLILYRQVEWINREEIQIILVAENYLSLMNGKRERYIVKR